MGFELIKYLYLNFYSARETSPPLSDTILTYVLMEIKDANIIQKHKALLDKAKEGMLEWQRETITIGEDLATPGAALTPKGVGLGMDEGEPAHALKYLKQ